VTATDLGAALDHLGELSRLLQKLTDELVEQEMIAVNAREDYVLAKEVAFLKSEGTQYVREAESKVSTTEVRRRAEGEEAKLRQLRAQVGAVKTRIEVGRTKVSGIKAEMTL
jgi:hypothetical protein